MPPPVDVAIDGCTDATNIDLGDTYLESMGRIAQFDVTIRNVCPNRRVALAINLTEVDQNGLEYQRGTKTMTIPAHTYPSCRDVHVKCVKFILPEDLSVSGGGTASMCSTAALKRAPLPTISTATTAAAIRSSPCKPPAAAAQ